jgi:hypothetical protein
MKKHFTRIVGCLVVCFCLIQVSANGAQIKIFSKENEVFSQPRITTPISNNRESATFILGFAIGVAGEEQETDIQRDHYPNYSHIQEATLFDYCQCVKIRIKSQEFTFLDQFRPAIFILYHCWKSYLS